jgi:hypothetical protein
LGLQKIKILSFILLVLVVVGINKETVKVEWTPGDSFAEWYEVRTRLRDKAEPVYFSSFRVNEPTHNAIVPRPRSGNFAVEVRACRKDPNNTTKDQCSVWITSDVQGEPEPWIIYWKPQVNNLFVIEDGEVFDGVR